jgi:hypothetical protein
MKRGDFVYVTNWKMIGFIDEVVDDSALVGFGGGSYMLIALTDLIAVAWEPNELDASGAISGKFTPNHAD